MTPSFPFPSPKSHSHVSLARSPQMFAGAWGSKGGGCGKVMEVGPGLQGVGKCGELALGAGEGVGRGVLPAGEGDGQRRSLGVGQGARLRAPRERGGERAQQRQRGGSAKVAPKFPALGAAP